MYIYFDPPPRQPDLSNLFLLFQVSDSSYKKSIIKKVKTVWSPCRWRGFHPCDVGVLFSVWLHRKPEGSHAHPWERGGGFLRLPQSNWCESLSCPFALSHLYTRYHSRFILYYNIFWIIVEVIWCFLPSSSCRKSYSPTKMIASFPSCHWLTCLRDSSR